MANRYAVATGNWSNTAIWDGGTLPQAGDVVRPNGFTVTIDQDIIVTELTNNASAPAVQGGQFTFGAGRILTTNISNRAAVSSFMSCTYGNGTSTINGNVIDNYYDGSTASLRVNGSLNGILIVNGDIYSNSGVGGTGGSGTVRLLGNGNGFRVVCNGLVSGIRQLSGGVVGDFCGIRVDNGYVIDINGIVEGKVNTNSNGGNGIIVNGTGNVINNYGLIMGGNGSTYGSCAGVAMPFSNGNTLNNYGQIRAVVLHPAIIGGLIVNQTGFVSIDNLNCLASRPFTNLMGSLSVEGVYTIPVSAISSASLYTAGLLTGYPLESKVEDGTVYGPSSEFEGTLLPWDSAFAQALATAQRDLQLPSILSAITAP